MKITFSKELESYGDYDVVVIGGGPAGVCAAVSAARKGMKTVIVEQSPSSAVWQPLLWWVPL